MSAMADDERLYQDAERDLLQAAQLLHKVKNDSPRMEHLI